MKRIACAVMIFLLQMQSALACSAFNFTTQQDSFVGKNYDWLRFHGHGALFVNKRGVAKTAEILRTGQPMKWISRYGSVTFNQIGQEFPMGGMNEAGLVVEILSLKETEHIPETDSRPGLNEAQFVQYQLDSYSSLPEVLANVDSLRVEQAFLGTHYFICDRSGECGVFEYIDHKLVVHSGLDLPIKLITNSTYEQSMTYWNDRQKRGDHADTTTSKSLPRFGRAAELLQNQSRADKDPFNYGFNILKEVEKDSFLITQWSMVYAQNQRLLQFRTQANPELKSLSLKDLDFSCQTPALMVDMQQPDHRDVENLLVPVADDANRELINKNWLLLGSELRTLAGDYPHQFTHCVGAEAYSIKAVLP